MHILSTCFVSPKDIRKMLRSATVHVSAREKRFSYVDFDNLKVARSFIVDDGHINGNEIHVLTFNAEILIFNFESRKLITVLFPRVEQVFRYYEPFGDFPPLSILDKAEENFQKGLNKI